MKRINYTVARLLSILAYALLVFIFCAIMIGQLEKNIQRSGVIHTDAQENTQRLGEIYQLHKSIEDIFPLRGSFQEKKSLLRHADNEIYQILKALESLNDEETKHLKRAYISARTLVLALVVELSENQYSEEADEILQGLGIHLAHSLDKIVTTINQRNVELLQLNSTSNALFVDLKSYMYNFCIVIALILLASGIYLNRLLRQPVSELAKAADEIRSGNLEYTLDVRDIPRDELGMLMRNFNVMARRLSHTAGRLEDANFNLRQEADVLQALAQQKTKFIRHLGHELRAPLSSIIGFAELLREGYYGDLTEKQEDYLGRIDKSANFLLSLVNDLVDQAKMQVGTLRLRYEDFEIKQFVNEVVSSFEAKADIEGIDLGCEFRNVSDKQTFSVDGKRIKQAMINLISNALKFTPAGESVTVVAVVERDSLIIDIKDTGIGIAEDDLEDIFYEFKQADTVKSSEGAGLGLPLSRQLLIMHGGNITVSSELGKGACFSMVVPLERPTDLPDIKETTINIF
ncbi:MAG: HAMP domain-containing histidine kinase [Lentisphaerales bacterium]|nr:HAMP domain-containing histidine kinase [Lentisphaerales bacterium]